MLFVVIHLLAEFGLFIFFAASAAVDAAAAAAAAATAAEAIVLLMLLYDICRVKGLEPKILRHQTGVLPMSYTHPF